MAAELFTASEGCPTHRLRLPPQDDAAGALDEIRYGMAGWPAACGPLTLESGHWPLHTGELKLLINLLERRDLTLVAVEALCPSTRVAAAALGLRTSFPFEGLRRNLPVSPPPTPWHSDHHAGSWDQAAATHNPTRQQGLLIHSGTLRSGDHLQAEGSILLLGDLNPGGRISAGGHVLVWGRLRGVAHAGRRGDRSARIVALQLQPLQLRIADAVARGPEDKPTAGLAEQAVLMEGEIQIEPASPSWPLGLND